jgi:prepilin-type N-terminal cleavage/methylation domain-containing protein
MTRALRRLRRAKADEQGFTLIELLVSMSIFALIMGLAIGVLIQTQKQVASTQIRLDDIDQARTSIDSLSRIVRTAVEPAQLELGCTSCNGPASTSTALTSAQASSIQLFANGGSAAGPNLVTFTASYDTASGQGILTRTVQKPDLNSAPDFTYTACTPGPASCLITKLIMVRGLQWPLPRALFNYYDNDGNELVPPANGSLAAQSLIAVDSVAINLTVKTANRFNTGPTSIYSLVELPNSGSGVLPTPGP